MTATTNTKTSLTFLTILCLACVASSALAQSTVIVDSPFIESPPMPVRVQSSMIVVEQPPVAVASSPVIPGDARKIAARYDAERAKVQTNARRQIRKLRQTLAASLETLQSRYARDAKLDEAVAIRECIRGLGGIQPMPDPGMLFSYGNSIGRALFFRVTGDSKKPIWGTNPYTPDSALSSAAVHAGVLKVGEAGVVKVTMLPGQSSYLGSTKNGITSSKWGNSPVSYYVEAVTERDEDAQEMSSTMSPAPAPGMPSPVRTYSYGGPSGYSATYEGTSRYSPASRSDWGSYPQGVFLANPVSAPAAKLPADAQRLLDDFQAASTAINKSANRKIAELRRTAVGDLKPLQDKYTRESRLDEAVSIRDYIRGLSESIENILPDPGAMSAFMGMIGRTFHFRVTGNRNGTIWGAGVYTADSALAATAVHAGALREGQTGVVKVTILPGRPSYPGVTRNGVTSHVFGNYPTSYRVEPADIDESVAADEPANRKPTPVATNPQASRNSANQVEELRREVTRLERSLREVITQLNQIREEEKMLKSQPPAR